jgi:peptidoglycan/LPS O-acetylase OafA/YrhL
VRRLGEVSFSLYLSHWPVVLVLRSVLVERGTSVTWPFALGALVVTF